MPPIRAISRCRSRSIDANPRLLFVAIYLLDNIRVLPELEHFDLCYSFGYLHGTERLATIAVTVITAQELGFAQADIGGIFLKAGLSRQAQGWYAKHMQTSRSEKKPVQLRSLVLPEGTISYTVRKHRQAKRLRIIVRPGGACSVTVPMSTSIRFAEAFLRQHSGWVIETLSKYTDYPSVPAPTGEEYRKLKEQARKRITERVRFFNRHYCFQIGRIAIRDQRTRWGSCSAKGNLNFNYRLIYLSDDLIDYLAVHEICHLAELNHSKRFWDLVAETVPDYRRCRLELKKHPLQ